MRRFFTPAIVEEERPTKIPLLPRGVLQICHPDWRGVREAAHAFDDPVVESNDLQSLVTSIPQILTAGATTVVIQGWPPGAGMFAAAVAEHGMTVLAVFHSSPAQHGVDIGEAEAVSEIFELQHNETLSGVATVKAGTATAYNALGLDITHISNRVPNIGDVTKFDVEEGTNAGILLYPMWRKNVTTQVLAVHQLGWRPNLMNDPHVAYVPSDTFTVWGELPRKEFLSVQAAMDISLNVTLSECHPMMPMESYRLHVPCLTSRTSDLFIDDPDLYELTTVDRPDDPDAIAIAAASLLENRDEAVQRANASLDRTDRQAAEQWQAFTSGGEQ